MMVDINESMSTDAFSGSLAVIFSLKRTSQLRLVRLAAVYDSFHISQNLGIICPFNSQLK